MGKAIEIGQLKSIKEGFLLTGRKAIITGAAGGIGRTTAAVLAELGADVALIDIRVDIAQEHANYIAKKHNVNAMAIACDVTDETQVEDMMAKVIKEFGYVDAVHSNAGIIMVNDNGDIDYDSWNKFLAVNLSGMFLINQKAAQHMRDTGRGGAIVNTASMSGHIINRGERSMVGYTSTKGAILQLTKAMAMDFCKDNIRVNSVSPGYMLSGIHDEVPEEMLDNLAKSTVPMGRFGNMDEIGGTVAFLLSDLASYITGTDILVDGGHCAW